MATATMNTVDIYAGIIDSVLSPAQKFDLIDKILATLRPVTSAISTKATASTKKDIFEGFSTDFGGEGSAVEIANNIRYSHPGSRSVEAW